jgi:GR25 family glycosyltransferase involved in LPS biosynthesis
MKLFERFDKVYLINLDRRPDRLENFQQEVEKYDLGDYEKISAVDGQSLDVSKYNTNLNPGEIGVILSNLQIIHNAKSNNYEKILIIEDDCYFTEEVKNINEYFMLLPDDWEMLYMGGNHNTHMGVPPPIKVNEKIQKLHSSFSAHLVGIKSNMYDFIEKSLKNLKEPLDVSYARLQKSFNAYSFFPAIAKQKSDYSDIQNKKVDYNWLIK